MILERYIAGNLVKGWLLVLLVLAAVFGLISFIGELERTRFGYDAMALGESEFDLGPRNLEGLLRRLSQLTLALSLEIWEPCRLQQW